MAERNTFSTIRPSLLVEKCAVFSACSTRRPLMVSRTSFAFCGLVRRNLTSARNSRTFSAAIFDITLILQTNCYATLRRMTLAKYCTPDTAVYLGFATVSAARAEWPLNRSEEHTSELQSL